MREKPLLNVRILVVEDEYLLAEELRSKLAAAGAVVVGVVSNVQDGLASIEAHRDLQAVILDVNLGGEPVFPLADRLLERGIPFLFTTGYDLSAIPPRFNEAPRCQKPLNVAKLIQAIQQMTGASSHD